MFVNPLQVGVYSFVKKLMVILILCLIGLLGCIDKTMPLDKRNEIKDNEKTTIEERQKKVKIEEAKPQIIKIVDPNTSKVIRTISPKKLMVNAKAKGYKQQVQEIARELARGTEIKRGYDQRMRLDKIDTEGQIIKGKPMIILKESELVDKIMKLSLSGGIIQLPLHVTESDFKVKEIPYLNEEVIASYSTHVNTSDKGRTKNIELSAKALNQVIVGKGDYFSFNTMVGQRSKENGYQPAPEIINKNLVMGIGGGVCQTSSTLFNAVDQLPVKYIERHHHSLQVGYVPKGRDATVSYGTLDFRFQNTTGIPFLITTILSDNHLTVELRTSKEYARSIKKK